MRSRFNGRIAARCACALMTFALGLTFAFALNVSAADYYQYEGYTYETEALYYLENAYEEINEESGYEVFIMDEAGLISDEDMGDVLAVMRELSEYGNVVLLTTDSNSFSAEDLAYHYYYDMEGVSSGCIFLIDMESRYLYIYSNGEMHDILTQRNADAITDNVYRMAKVGEYGDCAREAYTEIYQLMNGEEIARPFKYITNTILAAILALLINFYIAKGMSRTGAASNKQILVNVNNSYEFKNPKAQLVSTKKTYSPRSSGSGGSGGGGGGGHGGGGGGHGF